MERSIYNITLDIQRSHASTGLTVKRGDTHRQLRVRLVSGGRPYPVTDDCYAVFTAEKPDGTLIYNPCTRDGSTLVYDLTPQTTAAAGLLACEVKLYGGDAGLLTSAAFTITVEDTVYADGEEAITSTGEASALTQLITQARQTITQMEKVLANEVNHAVIDDTKVGTDAWSGKNIVDRLCPPFAESGSVVSCQPLEGYPLEVVTTLPESETGHTGITLYRGGKNLSPNINGSWVNNAKSARLDWNDNIMVWNTLGETAQNVEIHYYAGRSFVLPAGTYTFSATYVSGSLADPAQEYLIGLRKANTAWLMYIPMYGRGSRSRTFTLTEATTVAVCAIGNATIGFTDLTFKIQLEPGSTATDFEPYRGERFTQNFGQTVYGGSLDWARGILTDADGSEVTLTPQAIPAQTGVNYLFSDTGDTTVTGRKDIITLLDNL